MDRKPINFLDGNPEVRTKAMKEFFGLSPEQSFQDLTVDDNNNENNNNDD